MPREWTEPSSTQVGAIAENFVANALTIESGGRLSPFLPVADDDGIDLLIYDKETGHAIPIQVKSRTVTLKRRGSDGRGNTVHFEVRAATLKTDEFAYFVGVLLMPDMSSIQRIWFIPMKQLPAIARRGRTKFVIRANRSTTSKDKFTAYRCENAAEFTRRVLTLFSSRKRG
jgi:hypothetical protein